MLDGCGIHALMLDPVDDPLGDFAYWCTGMNWMTEALGFEECSRATNMTQVFNGWGRLETIWVTSFDASAIRNYTSVLYGCGRLEG